MEQIRSRLLDIRLPPAAPPELIAVSREPGLLDVFGLGTDFALYHCEWNGEEWSQWASLGGVFVSQPAAIATSQLSLATITHLRTPRSLA